MFIKGKKCGTCSSQTECRFCLERRLKAEGDYWRMKAGFPVYAPAPTKPPAGAKIERS